jgi:uncharacterized membrane-anchored protein
MKLPDDDPQRARLADEIHARPFEPLATPGAVLAIATLRSDASQDAACLAHLAALDADGVRRSGGATHLRIVHRGLRIKWERHNEFYSFIVLGDARAGALHDSFDLGWLDVLPAGWLAALPGPLIAAVQIALRACPGSPPHVRTVAPLFGSDLVIGSRIADGAATVVTDLRPSDRTTRFLVFDHTLNRRRAGRTAQRLVEVETYRMMALRSLPIATARMGELGAEERQLASLMERFRTAADGDDRLLAELLDLAARVEHAMADHGARFSATRAYRGIVDRRLAELRETTIPGLQPLTEFLARRFRPAMDSCAATEERQAHLAERIARAAQLLQTRSEVQLERQNQALLGSLDRRQGLQLRLQETVEGLSVLAMTYYGVGLAGYLLKPIAKAAGWNEALVTMLAVPVIGAIVLIGMRRLRSRLALEHVGPAQ